MPWQDIPDFQADQVFGFQDANKIVNNLRMLKPADLPSFFVWANQQGVPGNWVPYNIVWQNVDYNVGGMFNASTNEATLPFDGLYIIGVTVLLQGMNGEAAARLLLGGNELFTWQTLPAGMTGNATVGGVVVYRFSAGSILRVQVRSRVACDVYPWPRFTHWYVACLGRFS
jgi:hypothetical protein